MISCLMFYAGYKNDKGLIFVAKIENGKNSKKFENGK